MVLNHNMFIYLQCKLKHSSSTICEKRMCVSLPFEGATLNLPNKQITISFVDFNGSFNVSFNKIKIILS